MADRAADCKIKKGAPPPFFVFTSVLPPLQNSKNAVPPLKVKTLFPWCRGFLWSFPGCKFPAQERPLSLSRGLFDSYRVSFINIWGVVGGQRRYSFVAFYPGI